MRKSELKSGYIVETRTGAQGIVMLGTPCGDAIVSNEEKIEYGKTWFPLVYVKEDLTDPYDDDDSVYEIVKVWGWGGNINGASYNLGRRNLLFDKDKNKTTVKLNENYYAKINIKENIVEVGCQQININQVERLYETIQKLKK